MFNYVGVFTTDPAMVDLLHRLGVPAWGVVNTLPPGAIVKPAIPWERAVEMKPLEALDSRLYNNQAVEHDREGRTEHRSDEARPSYRSRSPPSTSSAASKVPRYMLHEEPRLPGT